MRLVTVGDRIYEGGVLESVEMRSRQIKEDDILGDIMVSSRVFVRHLGAVEQYPVPWNPLMDVGCLSLTVEGAKFQWGNFSRRKSRILQRRPSNPQPPTEHDFGVSSWGAWGRGGTNNQTRRREQATRNPSTEARDMHLGAQTHS